MLTTEPRCQFGWGCADCGACENTHVSRKNLLVYINERGDEITKQLFTAVGEEFIRLSGMRTALIDIKRKIEES